MKLPTETEMYSFLDLASAICADTIKLFIHRPGVKSARAVSRLLKTLLSEGIAFSVQDSRGQSYLFPAKSNFLTRLQESGELKRAKVTRAFVKQVTSKARWSTSARPSKASTKRDRTSGSLRTTALTTKTRGTRA